MTGNDALPKPQVISNVVKLWKKAQGKDPGYLAWKVIDRLAKKSRKYTRHLNGPKLDELLIANLFRANGAGSIQQHLLERTSPHFFFAQDEVGVLLAKMAADDAAYPERLLTRAERICKNQLDILAVGEMCLGEQIDWQRDYHSGLRWEQQYAFDYDFFALDQPSDVRIVWELNRLHFLVDLGKAYRWSNDEKYVRKFIELVCDWDTKNPYEFSVNWTCAMDVAIRAVNLIWALMFMLPSASLDDAFLTRLLRMLLQHGHYIRQNLEYADVRNNHYLADLVGLIYLGLFLPESGTARDWLEYALPRFEAEIDHEVYADGVSHEGSIPYHRLVVELFMSTALLLRLNGRTLAQSFYDRLERSLEFVQAYVKPDGLCPMFGDADDGRIHILGEQPINDHRYLLATGAVLFNRADFRVGAGRFWEEAAWLTGPQGLHEFEKLEAGCAPLRSRAFSEGGFYFLKRADDYVAVDCGDVGMRGRGGHGHCDILSFEASFGGENVVVDRGCYLYTASRSLRRESLVAQSHNTVIIDGQDYARLHDYDFAQVQNTPGQMLEWTVSDSGTVFEGEHYGYIDSQIVHRRRIELDNRGNKLLLTDRLSGSGPHAISARFYLAPGCTVKIDGAACFINTPRNRTLSLTVDGPMAGKWAVQPTTIFPRYGVEVQTSLLKWQAEVTLPAEMRFCWEPLTDLTPQLAGNATWAP